MGIVEDIIAVTISTAYTLILLLLSIGLHFVFPIILESVDD